MVGTPAAWARLPAGSLPERAHTNDPYCYKGIQDRINAFLGPYVPTPGEVNIRDNGAAKGSSGVRYKH